MEFSTFDFRFSIWKSEIDNRQSKIDVGWSTGLEPATTRTTIWGSTIELRPPSGIQILVFRRVIANAQRTHRCGTLSASPSADAPSLRCNPHCVCYHPHPAFHDENPLDPARRGRFLSGRAGLDRRIG